MKTNYEYVQDYLNAGVEMRIKAEEVLKDFGKELDVLDLCEQHLAERTGIKRGDENFEDAFREHVYAETYQCIYIDMYGNGTLCTIEKIKYNKETNNISVFLNSDEGFISEWFDTSQIYDDEAVYMTILYFIG